MFKKLSLCISKFMLQSGGTWDQINLESRNITWVNPLYQMATYQINIWNTSNKHVSVSGGKKCSFFGKFGVLCFLETPTLRFVLLPYCLRFQCFRQSSSHLKCLMLLVNWKVLASCNHFHNFSFYHIEVVW